MVRPRNLVDRDVRIEKVSKEIEGRLPLKQMNLVLSTFKERLFESHHNLTDEKSSATTRVNVGKSGPFQVMEVSSANRVIFPLMFRKAMSLIKMRNSIGPRTDPCGTPY